jgi:hypothetical protein
MQTPAVDLKFLLSFVEYCTYVVVAAVLAMTVLGTVALFKAGGEAIKPVAELIIRGDGLRMLTVIFIIGATTLLASIGLIKGESAVAVFSGVAGFVLGGVHKSSPKPKSQGDTTAND